MTMTKFALFLIVVGFVVLISVAEDSHENCRQWAEMGECEKNQKYMQNACAESCEEVGKKGFEDSKELEGITSFFDLSANEILGNRIEFKKFKGQVTVLVNVASDCGYTDSHYRGLVKLWGSVKHTNQINILAFPCNQFGQQEPGSASEINDFAVAEYGVDFTMMEKIDVNGNNASIIYKYLKSKTGPAFITWNFATYYVVGPEGIIQAFSGVEPMELKDTLMDLLQTDEL
mmetsp:Transcript_56629/g.64069  ORF Transcript_56629/g.64069 Transcript_56629/m.64069 type:complete len:231 (+) Transcript_56629:125-817(+)